MIRTRSLICVGLAAAALGCCLVEAQTNKPPEKKVALNPAEVRALDREAKELQKTFVDSLEDVAGRYELAGDIEKAKAALSRVLELDPEREKVKERLEEMRNRVFDNNEVEVEVDVTRGWVTSGLKVRKEEAVRIAAEGSYKLILTASVSPDGVATADLNRDLVDRVTLGELMGVVFPPPKGRQKPKPGKPFAIGSQLEFSPEESGMLFLRLNVPTGTKSVGSVKVKISGHFDR